jgi:hypothetical protein
MKKFTLKMFFLGAGLIASSGLFAQATYKDDFNTAKDYLKDGVTGSIWDGYYIDMHNEADDTLKIFDTSTNAGALTISANNTAWAPDAETGFFLYKNLKAKGADFDAKVKIVGGTLMSLTADGSAVPYFMPGLMVRAKGAAVISFVQTQAFDHLDYNNAVYRIWNAPDVESTGDDSWTPRNKKLADIGLGDIEDTEFTVKAFPWIRLQRVDGMVSSSVSDDGITWFKIWETERYDLDEYELEVGLSHTTYTDQTGTIVFDDFSLTDASATNTGVEMVQVSPVNAFSKGNNIVVNSSKQISSLKLVGIDGSVKMNIKKVNANTYTLPVENKGVYIVLTESEGKSHAQKVAVY